MAELLTIQDLANGHLDVQALGSAANGDENTTVTTRTGNTYPSAKKAIKTMFKAGGLPAEPFATKALMTASAVVDGKYAQVTDDTTNNGLYLKTAGAWVKSAYDPLTLAKADATIKADAAVQQSQQLIKDELGYEVYTNILNLSPANVNKGYFSGDGIVDTSSVTHRHCTDYFPVKIGDKFWMTPSIRGYEALDANKNLLWGVINPNFPNATAEDTNRVWTVPPNYSSVSFATIAFVRFSFVGGDVAITDNTVAVGRGDTYPGQYIPPNKSYLQLNSGEGLSEAVKNISTSSAFVKYDNIINPNQETAAGFFGDTGIYGAGGDFAGYIYGKDFYKAEAGDEFWLKNISSLQVYDVNKTALGSLFGEGLAPSLVNGVYTITGAAVKYIRFSTAGGEDAYTAGRVAVGYGDTAPIGTPEFGSVYYEPKAGAVTGIEKALGLGGNPLSGKHVALMGDSISNYPNCFLKQLADVYGASLVKYTRDGAKVHRATVGDTNLIMSEEYLNMALTPAPDLIIIACGVNDTPDTLGVSTDRTNVTFYGGLHVLLSGLRNRFPEARIGYISPIARNMRYVEGDVSNVPYHKHKIISEVCAYYSVPVWNGNKEFGASPLDSTAWATKYMPDGLHPSYEGHTWYANRVENFVLSLAK